MSHRAIVAINNKRGRYDLYYSHNGADDLNLTEPLEEYVAGSPGGVDTVANTRLKQLPQFEQWQRHNTLTNTNRQQPIAHNANRSAIDPDPMYTDVSLDKIAYFVRFDTIEAFYLVRDGTVETYVPVWMEPNVIRPWRDHLSVEVYPMRTLPDDPREIADELDSADPVRVIDEETLTGTDWRDDRIVTDLVRSNHEYVHALHRTALAGDSPADANTPADNPVTQLMLETYLLQIESEADGELTASPNGRGLLVRIPNNDRRRYRDITETANTARLEAGARLNTRASIDSEAETEARTTLAKVLFKHFGDHIAAISPQPYRSIVNELAPKQAGDEDS